MVERVQALESGIWVWTVVLLFNSSLPLGKSFNFWASCFFINMGSIPTHQKTIVRTKCESTTYRKVEHMIVTYLCQFCFPSRGRHKGTCFICLFNVLWIWRFGLPEVYLWISTCVYIGYFLLEVGPPKTFWSREESDPSVVCIPHQAARRKYQEEMLHYPQKNGLL